MQSLHELRSVHPKLLVMDSASTLVQVGLLSSGTGDRWYTSQGESGVEIFKGAESLLQNTGHTLEELDGFVFCEGPGSVLGIRTAAVAIRTWQMLRSRPCYSYRSLELVVAFQLQRDRPAPFNAIADARRELWHCVQADAEEKIGPVQRLATSEISGPSITPDVFRRWSQLPTGVEPVPYTIEEMLKTVSDVPLFRQSLEPDAFLHEEPVYRTWSPQIHRAPF